MTEVVNDYDLEPKPEINVQFGVGGTTDSDVLEEQGQMSPEQAIERTPSSRSQSGLPDGRSREYH